MIYTYKCDKCEKEEDRLVKLAEAEQQSCNDCGEKLKQVDTFATAFRFKGRW